MLVSEKEIQNGLLLLSSYANMGLHQEVTILNTLDRSSVSRRFDIVQYLDNSVRVYELKRDVISEDHIVECIGRRGYYELAKKKWPNAQLVFVSPNGITTGARRLLSGTNIGFISVQDLAKAILDIYKASLPDQTTWMVDRVRDEFKYLFQ